jgi:molecular chaperone GrpE (heat shock protein)
MHAPEPFPSDPATAPHSDAPSAPAEPAEPGGPVPDAPDARAAGAAEPVDRQSALRALRSLEATEARLARNARRELDDARGKLVQELLPVLDNLDRTIRAAYDARSDRAMLDGVRMVRHQLEGVLRGYGVERIEALDQRFDPNLHEAIGVASVSDPRRHGIVVHQAEPGYRFGDRLLRPAKVSVGKLVSPVDTVHRPVWR